jgi:hypothetical protein
MSADITIANRDTATLELEIGANSVGIYIDVFDSGALSFYFDMRSAEQRNELKKLVSHLQHQIDVHEIAEGRNQK